MNDGEFRDLILRHSRGDLSPEEHAELQERLRSDPGARAAFREQMDFEAGLRIWAAERPASRNAAELTLVGKPRRVPHLAGLLALAASLLLVAGIWWFGRRDIQPDVLLGRIHEAAGCIWEDASARRSGEGFAAGPLRLAEGLAELRFDSGTSVVLEGPCELRVVSADAVGLRGGKVAVRVGEGPDGFVLDTPEARILDEGTEYDVSVESDETEVHVFDGAVLWSATDGPEERIEAGEARRYSRRRLGRGARIPLDARRFVRQLEEGVRGSADGMLVAYDGFEYLAGHLRRGRHGFGWSDGWRSGTRGRGKLAAIVEAPDDRVLGVERKGRRLLRLADGDAIRRGLEAPLRPEADGAIFLSYFVTRGPGEGGLEISLGDGGDRPRRRSPAGLIIGIDADGLVFVGWRGEITRGTRRIAVGAVHLLVLMVVERPDGRVEARLRLYDATGDVDPAPPSAWDARASGTEDDPTFGEIRLAVDPGATWDLDELKIGRTWASVTFTET